MPDIDHLARVTVSAPHRRLDVALPAHAPLAELLPELLRHAGDGLADEGQAHGGWVLRRSDGAALSASAGLTAQGVRDGAVLHLVPARTAWPELDYDDVVEAIASAAARHGRTWDGGATRATALGVAGLVAVLGVVALVRAPIEAPLAGLVALGAALVLLLTGVIAGRAYGDGVAGAALAGYALPYAVLGGLTVLADGQPRLSGPHALVASVALVLWAVAGAVGVGAGLRLFVGAGLVGLAGAVGAVVAGVSTPAGAAAVVLTGLVTGLLVVPVLAVRLGRLPVPVPTPVRAGAPAAAHPDREAVFAAVVRADHVLTGLLLGVAAGAVLADLWLIRGGGTGGRVLVAVAAGALLLRARVYPAVRQRLPLLLAGVAGGVALLATLPPTPATVVVAAGLVLAVPVLVVAGAVYRRRTPGPYLGRAADLLDALCVVSVIPAACAVLGLYGVLRNLGG